MSSSYTDDAKAYVVADENLTKHKGKRSQLAAYKRLLRVALACAKSAHSKIDRDFYLKKANQAQAYITSRQKETP